MPAFPMDLPWVESPFFESLLREKSLSPEEAVLARHYHEHGYVKLEGLVTEDEARAVIEGAQPLYTPAAEARAAAPASWTAGASRPPSVLWPQIRACCARSRCSTRAARSRFRP
jgi:hypothetical protein